MRGTDQTAGLVRDHPEAREVSIKKDWERVFSLDQP